MPLWQRQEVQAVPRRIGECRSQCDEFVQQSTSTACCPFYAPCLLVTNSKASSRRPSLRMLNLPTFSGPKLPLNERPNGRVHSA